MALGLVVRAAVGADYQPLYLAPGPVDPIGADGSCAMIRAVPDPSLSTSGIRLAWEGNYSEVLWFPARYP